MGSLCDNKPARCGSLTVVFSVESTWFASRAATTSKGSKDDPVLEIMVSYAQRREEFAVIRHC